MSTDSRVGYLLGASLEDWTGPAIGGLIRVYCTAKLFALFVVG